MCHKSQTPNQKPSSPWAECGSSLPRPCRSRDFWRSPANSPFGPHPGSCPLSPSRGPRSPCAVPSPRTGYFLLSSLSFNCGCFKGQERPTHTHTNAFQLSAFVAAPGAKQTQGTWASADDTVLPACPPRVPLVLSAPACSCPRARCATTGAGVPTLGGGNMPRMDRAQPTLGPGGCGRECLQLSKANPDH